MKHLFTLLLTAAAISVMAQTRLTTGYSLSAPQQKMNDNINLLHSLAAGIEFKIPGTAGRLALGAEGSWGLYANTSKEQTFNFGNGVSTRTMVNYSSNVWQGALTGKLFLLKEKGITPYVSGKAGYTGFYSNIFIEDPHDADGCRPLDQKTLISDAVMTLGYGGGLQIDWSLFSKESSRGKNFIDLRVQNIRGGNMDYINTKKLIDANNPPTGGGGKPLNVQFINATTNQIHEHQVAEVFTTPLRMMEIKLSAVFSIGD
jgi:hypothetical protein